MTVLWVVYKRVPGSNLKPPFPHHTHSSEYGISSFSIYRSLVVPAQHLFSNKRRREMPRHMSCIPRGPFALASFLSLTITHLVQGYTHTNQTKKKNKPPYCPWQLKIILISIIFFSEIFLKKFLARTSMEDSSYRQGRELTTPRRRRITRRYSFWRINVAILLYVLLAQHQL